MDNKTILGIISIILGILIIVFPLASNFIFSVLLGISFLILGIYYLMIGCSFWKYSKASSVIYLLIGILSVIFALFLMFSIVGFEIVVGFYFYLVGFMLLISGIIRLITSSVKSASLLSIILGILMIILGAFALLSPVYVAILIGISVIAEGIDLLISRDF